MAGFENDVVFAKNADFTRADNQDVVEANGLITNGQLWVGSTALNAGGTHINVGSLTSPSGTVGIGYATPDITLTTGPTLATTYTENSGSATPSGQNLNVLGNNNADNGFATWTTGSGSTVNTISHGVAKWVVHPTANVGTHTTIASAITSAVSGETIFITPGTYTENLTLKAGVNLTAFECDSSFNGTGKVIISGTCTMTTAGTVTISGIQLQTNSAELLAVTGSAASIVNLNNCYLNITNNTGITLSSSSSSARINIRTSNGNLGTTGIAIFSHSSAGNLTFNNTTMSNSGGSSTANTCSSGTVTMITAFIGNPITFSGTGSLTTCKYSEIDSSGTNSTALTTVSGQTHRLDFVRLASGTATPFSAGGTNQTNALLLDHSNATAISGAGTLTYNSIFQNNTVGALTTTTLTPKGHIGMQNSTVPAAGYIGESVFSEVLTGSAVNLTNGTATNITSITITPGTWLISGFVIINTATTTTVGRSGINTTSATFSANLNQGPLTNAAIGGQCTLICPDFYINASAATTTVYLIGAAFFTVGTSTGYGNIRALRIA